MSQRPCALTIRLFGTMQVWVDGKPLAKTRTRKERHLLALLALRDGELTDREWLASQLWPESLPSQYRANLRRSLCELTSTLGKSGERIQSQSGEIAFDFADCDVDVTRFASEIKVSTPDSLRTAIELHSAPLLEGVHEPWAERERALKLETYIKAVQTLTLWIDPDEEISILKSAIWMDPTREALVRQLLGKLTATGAKAAALETYWSWKERLERSYSAAPSVETVRFAASLKSLEAASPAEAMPGPALKSGARPYGRNQHLSLVSSALRDSVIVSLVGLPGVGKTRIARAISEIVDSAYSGDVAHLDGSATSEEGLAAQIAAALQITPATTLQELSEAVRRQKHLILFDEIDSPPPHLLKFLESLTKGSPRCRVLTTSRRPLPIANVFTIPIPPLEVGSGSCLSPSPAVQLFVSCARNANSDFRLTEETYGLVEEICRQLDGLPLAIQVVAAWVDTLSLATIGNRLAVRLALEPSASGTDGLEANSLRAALAESLDHLNDDETELYSRCTLFPDGFTLEGAMAVCQINEFAAAYAVRGLVQKSLLLRDDTHSRYQILGVLKEVVGCKFEESYRDETRRRIADYYRNVIATLEENPDRFAEDVPDIQFVAERANIEDALRWWRETDGEIFLELEFLYFHWRVLPLERMTPWISRVESGLIIPERLRAAVYACVGVAAVWGQRDGATKLLQQSLEAAIENDQPRWEAHVLNFFSVYYGRISDFSRAEQAIERSIEAAKRAGMSRFAELCIADLNWWRWKQSRLGAIEGIERQLAKSEVTGSWQLRYSAVKYLSAICREINKIPEAYRHISEAVRLARLHCQHELVNALIEASQISCDAEDYEAAVSFLEEALSLSRKRGPKDREAAVYRNFARVMEIQGRLAEADDYLKRACRLLEKANLMEPMVELLLRRAEIAHLAENRESSMRFVELADGMAFDEGVTRTPDQLSRIEKLSLQT